MVRSIGPIAKKAEWRAAELAGSRPRGRSDSGSLGGSRRLGRLGGYRGGSTFGRSGRRFGHRFGFAGIGFHFLVSSLYGQAPAAGAVRDGWQAFRGFTGARLYRPAPPQTKTLQIQHTPVFPQGKRPQTRLWSSPWRKMSCGRSMPMNTILLTRASPSAHWGPKSLPMSWCTPWKITLRSVPFMFKTPL